MRSLVILISSVLLTIILLSGSTNSAKILNLVFFSSKSHKITYEPLLQELAARGHEVTVVSPIVFGNKKIKEIHTYDVDKLFDNMPNIFEMKENSEQMNPSIMMELMRTSCIKSYDHPEVLSLLNQQNEYDLVILPSFFNDCAFGIAYKLNAPILIMSPAAAPPTISSAMGTPSPSSFVANMMTPYSDRMTFYQRTCNFLVDTFILGLYNFYFKPTFEAIYREKLNDASLPSIDKIMSDRVSIMLSNSHLSLGQPRPYMPDIIEVGGMHCRSGKPLPKDLEDFVSSSGEDGFILFSMGSALQGSTMPDERRKTFLAAFGKLKQKVLWKWETETMADLPPNVKLSKWLPQQDVLGHPKIKGFITHGGLGSTTEAVYHGVPLIGIPMFADQNLNMAKAENVGFGITLEYTELTEDLIVNAVNRIVKEKSYKDRVQQLSKVFRDQPDKPLDRAVFWTEYVLRHKGAPHLRSPARDLNFFQYHSLDVVFVLIVAVSVILYIAFVIMTFVGRKVCAFLFGSSKSQSSNQHQRQNKKLSKKKN